MPAVSIPESYTLPFFDHQITAASSSRHFKEQDYPLFLRQCGIAESCFNRVKQVHGDVIVEADGEAVLDQNIEADGLITAARKTAIAVRTADCLPVFFWDPLQKVAGIAHAGWRGVHQRILSKMAARFKEDFDCSLAALQVAIGPAIRSCCYEVGAEFQEYFPRNFKPGGSGDKGFMDLAQEAVDQLNAAGIRSHQIFDSGICTVCRNDRFFSARKEKTPERILSFIYIK